MDIEALEFLKIIMTTLRIDTLDSLGIGGIKKREKIKLIGPYYSI